MVPGPFDPSSSAQAGCRNLPGALPQYRTRKEPPATLCGSVYAIRLPAAGVLFLAAGGAIWAFMTTDTHSSVAEAMASGAVAPLRIGDLLVQAGKLSARDLERALSAQQEMGGMLGRVLVRLGLSCGLAQR